MEFSPIKTRSILGARNKSQRWLADAAGLHVNTIYNLLSGDEETDKIFLYTVNSIAAALECAPLDLMNTNGTPTQRQEPQP